MQRNPRTLLPSAKPYCVKAPNYSSAYYNQGAKSLPSLSAHDTVRIQNGTSWATKGKVIEPLEYPPRSYTVETESGHRLRRNRRDLLSTKEEFTPSPDIGIAQPSTNTSVEQDQHSTDPHSTYGEESQPTSAPIYTRSGDQWSDRSDLRTLYEHIVIQYYKPHSHIPYICNMYSTVIGKGGCHDCYVIM